MEIFFYCKLLRSGGVLRMRSSGCCLLVEKVVDGSILLRWKMLGR